MATSRTSRASGRPRTGGFSGKYQVIRGVELSPKEEAEVQRQLEQLESEKADISTALRWGRAQIDIVRRAAGLTGVPYQSYLKQAAIRSAIGDLRAAREVGLEVGAPNPISSGEVTRERKETPEWTLVLGASTAVSSVDQTQQHKETLESTLRSIVIQAAELLEVLSSVVDRPKLPPDKAAELDAFRIKLELLGAVPQHQLTSAEGAAYR